MHKSYKAGIKAEAIALWLLRFKGYCLLEQRYKTSYGEVDLIMRRGNILVGVEVKYRKTMEDALHALSLRQCHRIENAIKNYLVNLTWQPDIIRFDIVCLAPHKKPVHIQNAWQPLS